MHRNKKHTEERLTTLKTVKKTLVCLSLQCRSKENGESPSFSLVLWIHNGRNGAFVDGVFSSVPLGVHLLLLELGELAAVVDDHEQFPDEQQSQTDEDNPRHDSQNDRDDVGAGRALEFIDHVDLLGAVPDGVGEIEPAVVLVPLFAVGQRKRLVRGLGQVTLFYFEKLEVVTVVLAHVLLLSGLEGSALDTVFVLGAHSGAGGTRLTGLPLELGVVANTGATLTGSSSVTDLTVFGQTRGLVQGAVAGAARVVGVADALPALTAAVSSTELVVGAVTVEVVTLAVGAAVDLGGVLSLLTLAGAADAVPVVAADVGAVVLSTVGVQVLGSNLVFAALTESSDTALVTFAGAALERPVSVVALLALRLAPSGALTLTDEVQHHLHFFVKAQGSDFDHLRFNVCRTLLRLDGNLEGDLVSDGDVVTLPAVLSGSYDSVFTDGLVRDGDSFWKFGVLQESLRRQRVVGVDDQFDDVAGVGGKSTHG